MLYLDSLENLTQNPAQNRFAICHKDVEGLRTIPELTPSVELLEKWNTQQIEWESFQTAFKAELRQEYNKGDNSRLKGLAKYCVENEVVLYSPEPPGEQTYRAILTEVLNAILKSTGATFQATDRATRSSLSATHRHQMENLANSCEYYQPLETPALTKSCLHCEHLETHIYTCQKLSKPVIQYEWN